jgi:deoxyadenosine/deoxycytidine kinase
MIGVARGKVVIVEGLIGAGKTSLTRELGAALGDNTLVLFEPDEKRDKNPYLADYYDDPKRWGFTLQVHQLQARYRMHLQAQWHAMQGAGHAVLDRSYFGDTAFARLQHNLGWVSDREFETYSSIYHAMTSAVLLPNVCVRVLVSPDTCERRIMRRMRVETGRECEQKIDKQYLVDLDCEIGHMVDVLRGQGVAVLDVPWDEDRDNPDDRKEAVAGLAARIQSVEPQDFFLDMHRKSL